MRSLAREHGLGWNYSAGQHGTVDEFRRLADNQPDPQVQLFLSQSSDVTRDLDDYARAGATRAVVVLTPPVEVAQIHRVARAAGLR